LPHKLGFPQPALDLNQAIKKKSSRFRALCDVYDTFNDHSNRFSYSLYRISVEGRVFMKTQVKIT